MDERVRKISVFSKLLIRPEMASIGGVIIIFTFFGLTAATSGMFSSLGIFTFLELSAELAIIAIGASMLMIGGEFDLSIGSTIGFLSVFLAVLPSELGIPIYATLFLTFGLAMLIGYINGILVVKTGLPSFIVTLAMLFILRGAALVFIRSITNRTQAYLDRETLIQNDPLAWLFGGKLLTGFFDWLAQHGLLESLENENGEITSLVGGISPSLVWALLLIIVTTWVLSKTRLGNWIFATGGDPIAARNVGVPVRKVKIGLFMFTAFCAFLLAAIQVLSNASADALRGELKEFEAIISSVIGGTLLTGGYGSTIGAALGALIFGTIGQGLNYIGVDANWFKIFLGLMVLVAVVLSNSLRKRATGRN